jgi:hypothetical protein
MALTYTPNEDLKLMLPQFKLTDVFDQMFDSNALLAARAKLIVFLCGHCPYVQAIESRLISLGHDLKALGVPMVGICSNDPKDYPEDSPTALRARHESKRYSFPYLIDADQAVARAFGAVCTPDFFLFNGQNHLVYRGRLDDFWKDEKKVTRRELFQAAKLTAEGKDRNLEMHPAMGCSIKWREPHGI